MKLLLFLLLATSLYAADVVVTGILYHPNGTKANCTLTINGPSGIGTTSSTGHTITPGRFVYNVLNGAYTFVLTSNIGMTPSGTSYRTQYQCRDGQASYNETWVVPATGPVTIDQIRVATTPAPNVKFNISQLNSESLPNGTYCVLITNGVPSFVTCTTTPGGLLFDAASGLFDSASGLFDSH